MCRWWPNIECWFGSHLIFQGIGTSIARKPYIFVIFQGGSGPPVPPPLGSTHNTPMGGYLNIWSNKYSVFIFPPKFDILFHTCHKLWTEICETNQHFNIVANRKLASTYKPVAFRSVHTGIEPPFLLIIYYAITACMTRSFTSRNYLLKEKW